MGLVRTKPVCESRFKLVKGMGIEPTTKAL